MRVDVHQHLWPRPFIDALRRRTRPPSMDGWTLVLDGESPTRVDPADHDPVVRARRAVADGFDRVLLAPSTPLGVEELPAAQARPLIDAYHDGVAALGAPFSGWATTCLSRPDPAELAKRLDAGFVGLTLPATALLGAAGYAHCAPLLDVLADAGRPLFVHPGPVRVRDAADPVWWPALVDYVHQMHTAWFAFRVHGRPRHPRLRVCVDDAFVETSSYGPRAVDAVVRVLGIDTVAIGSDRPYAAPMDYGMGEAAARALCVTNPERLLGSASRGPGRDPDIMEVQS